MQLFLAFLPLLLLACLRPALGVTLPFRQAVERDADATALSNSTYVIEVQPNDATSLIVNPAASTGTPPALSSASLSASSSSTSAVELTANPTSQITSIPPPLNAPTNTDTISHALPTAYPAVIPSAAGNRIAASGSVSSGAEGRWAGSASVGAMIGLSLSVAWGVL